MDHRQRRRITRVLSAQEQERMYAERSAADADARQRPTTARQLRRREALEENSLSGQLRRAIAAAPQGLSALAEEVGVKALVLDDFLSGERTLQSDVLDRIAKILGCRLVVDSPRSGL